MSSKTHIRLGVFIPYGAQFLDVSPVDIFGMLDPTYLAVSKLPSSLVELGTPSTIYYIGLSGLTSKQTHLTANATLIITHTTQDPEVQPGELDILMIPGPDPNTKIGAEAKAFLLSHAKVGETDVLSICTGCYLLAESGALIGRKASGPRALVRVLKKQYPETRWDEDRRWVNDENIWSSGGVTNGQEMVAAYIREKFPGPTAEAVIAMADVGEKGNEYRNSAKVDGLWWVWQVLKAVMMGGVSRPKKLKA